VKTVSTYRARILEKLHLKTNADLTSYAMRNEIIQ
jgi:DNA-binding NarL/FixJ family response regulator